MRWIADDADCAASNSFGSASGCQGVWGAGWGVRVSGEARVLLAVRCSLMLISGSRLIPHLPAVR